MVKSNQLRRRASPDRVILAIKLPATLVLKTSATLIARVSQLI